MVDKFVNYFGVKEVFVVVFEYYYEEDYNLLLRGWFLVIVFILLFNFFVFQKWFWNNVKFGQFKYVFGFDSFVFWCVKFDVVFFGEMGFMLLFEEGYFVIFKLVDCKGWFNLIVDYYEFYKLGQVIFFDVVEVFFFFIRRDVGDEESKYVVVFIEFNVDEVF